MPRLALLHTAALHEPRFARLHAEYCADLPLLQHSEPALLDLAREHGDAAPIVAEAVIAACRGLADAGASSILCTCSTIGALAESSVVKIGVPVLRVDRAMAADAVALARQGAGRIVLLITLESTRVPSQVLLQEEARRVGVSIELRTLLVAGAFDAAMVGDAERANHLITDALQALAEAGEADVAVLAQVSMADAQPAGGVICALPVLASPVLGLCSAAVLCRAG